MVDTLNRYGLEFSLNGKSWVRVPETLRCASRLYLERHSRVAIDLEAEKARVRLDTPYVRIVTVDDYLLLAADIVDSDPVIRTYAASEWAELSDDGKEWIAAIVREATIRAIATHLPPNSGPAPLGRSGAARVAPARGAIGGER